MSSFWLLLSPFCSEPKPKWMQGADVTVFDGVASRLGATRVTVHAERPRRGTMTWLMLACKFSQRGLLCAQPSVWEELWPRKPDNQSSRPPPSLAARCCVFPSGSLDGVQGGRSTVQLNKACRFLWGSGQTSLWLPWTNRNALERGQRVNKGFISPPHRYITAEGRDSCGTSVLVARKPDMNNWWILQTAPSRTVLDALTKAAGEKMKKKKSRDN